MLKLKLQRIREEQMKQMADAESTGGPKPNPAAIRPFIKKEEDVEETEEDLQKQVRKKVDLAELDDMDLNEAQREAKWRALTPERLEMATTELYGRGTYSPTYGDFNDTMPGNFFSFRFKKVI